MHWIEIGSIVFSIVSAIASGLWLNTTHGYGKDLFAVIGVTAILVMIIMKMGGILPVILLEGAIASVLKDNQEKYRPAVNILIYTVLFIITFALGYIITGFAGGVLHR